MEQDNLNLMRKATKPDPDTFRYYDNVEYNFDTIHDLLITGNSNLGISILAVSISYYIIIINDY